MGLVRHPLKAGSHNLYLTVSAVVNIPGLGAQKREIPVLTQSVQVRSNVEYTTGEFWQSNWQWFTTTLLLPLGLWIWKKRKTEGAKTAVTLLLLLVTSGLVGARAQSYEALDDQAMQQWKARDYANAVKTFERALQAAQAMHDLDKQRSAKEFICSAYGIQGNFPAQLKCTEEVQAFQRQNHDHFHYNEAKDDDTLRTFGDIYVQLGNYGLAIKNLRASLAICQAPKADCGANTGRILRDLGIALYFSGDLKGAEQLFRQAAASSHGFNERAAVVTKAVVPTTDLEMEALRWLERVLVAQHRTDEALEVMQLCRAGDLSVELRTRLGQKFTQKLAAPGASQLKSLAHDENATLVDYSLVYKSNLNIPLEFSGFDMLPVTGLYIWIIHPSGAIDFRQQDFGANGFQLAAMVKDVRNSITSSNDKAARTRLSQRAYQLFISPIENILPSDPKATVLFVPQDTLYLLPFAALQDASGHYLIEKHTIASEVSLEVLQLGRQQLDRLPKTSTALMAIGNPTPPAGYPPLPGAEKEANAVANLFSATPLTGAQATKTAFISHAGDARILHLATHGILNSDEGQLSSLVLAPDRTDSGFLSALEVRAMTLHAELAVLSACDTGQGNLTGDGVLGIGRSFVEAGVSPR